jgi:DNA-binding NarL/FixJ family response regulator
MPDEAPPSIDRHPAKRIVLLDPHTFVRECVAQCLKISYDDAVVTSFTTIEECLQDYELRDIAFILYNVHQRRPSDPQVEQNLKDLKEAFGQVPLILLSDEDGPDRIFEALERGARGYIPPNATLEVAIGATRLVCAGGTFIPASSFTSLASKRRPAACGERITEQFTHRQLAVLKCLRQGKANRLIAAELGMSEGTVKAHVRNIMQKLRATNRTQVVFLTREIFGDI